MRPIHRARLDKTRPVVVSSPAITSRASQSLPLANRSADCSTIRNLRSPPRSVPRLTSTDLTASAERVVHTNTLLQRRRPESRGRGCCSRPQLTRGRSAAARAGGLPRSWTCGGAAARGLRWSFWIDQVLTLHGSYAMRWPRSRHARKERFALANAFVFARPRDARGPATVRRAPIPWVCESAALSVKAGRYCVIGWSGQVLPSSSQPSAGSPS
jgi:hypothetical protein